MSEAGVDDAHGFFQFADFSDSDSDDGLFGKPRDRRISFDATKINYKPKIDTDNWYDRSATTPVAQWLAQHSGLDEITYTVQRLYFTRQYAEAASLCHQASRAFIERHRGSLRMATIREILETGGRAAVRAGDLALAGVFCDMYAECGGMNPGYDRFLAETLWAVGRRELALERCVGYLVQRRQDARVWEMVGRLVAEIGEEGGGPAGGWRRLALAAFFRAHYIIDCCKNWAETGPAVRQKGIQTGELLDGMVGVLRRVVEGCGMLDEEHLWLACKAESATDRSDHEAVVASCAGGLAKSMRWVCDSLALSAPADDDDVDDGERNVEEL
ncbi:hypothetical protein GGI15_003712 [Coemansia interrupta]|uniref:Uncharacterized protein n=1 Tax=Coemansia interrupta TaxID=1126814 RepID=A0A9W8LFW1_9FUNG|nr:hypothetical protein GGI15_003712 [Coemansia interrupta]